MLTPKEVEEQRFPLVQFRKGYEIGSVDTFLDTLTADYSALYEENAALKAKMKVLVQYISDQARHIRDLELTVSAPAAPVPEKEEEEAPAEPVRLTILPPAESQEEEPAEASEALSQAEAEESVGV